MAVILALGGAGLRTKRPNDKLIFSHKNNGVLVRGEWSV